MAKQESLASISTDEVGTLFNVREEFLLSIQVSLSLRYLVADYFLIVDSTFVSIRTATVAVSYAGAVKVNM